MIKQPIHRKLVVAFFNSRTFQKIQKNNKLFQKKY